MTEDPHDSDAGAAIRRHATRFEAPEALRTAILEEPRPVPAVVQRDSPWRRLVASLLMPAASFAMGAVIAGVCVAVYLQGSAENPLVAAMVSDHARAIVSGQTIEVASADTHTVKPWLSAKLGYSPIALDLVDLGYPLRGGRRGFIGRTPVGVMVYQAGQHEIDVYTLPIGEFSTLPAHPGGQSGYNMLSWRSGDIQYVVVSDASGERLHDFAESLQQRQKNALPKD